MPSGHLSDRYIWRYIKPDRQTLAEAIDELDNTQGNVIQVMLSPEHPEKRDYHSVRYRTMLVGKHPLYNTTLSKTRAGKRPEPPLPAF
jgi:hypothetical protein